ncbi:c-type cytochrome biogenesis protein CcsB [Thermosynechococcus sp. CL-1]|uniref:c-type cytochrome biogenesis protein CcsB n=1 Tax=unclassified Thermosynechococcus TaxID=2622553 RepID=UPI00122E3B66|nr:MULTISPECIES: c-type cytochrome biogenesis protein CcsB [unclassified Thermosynechococcus]QEQ01420.1 c-type cytochrome biogenesis protein CcsB [Thermosynechococcus sp. CL-1]WJI25790.1 c-type cytochrome biogenesis protein CcsB [Thermosynechococcus sp. B1]
MDLLTLEGWLDNTAFAVLLITMLLYWCGAAFPQWPVLTAAGRTGMAIANLCITGLLAARWIEGGYFPISNLYESLFFLCWGLTAMHFVAESISGQRLVGVVTAPVAMGITAFAALSLPPEMQQSAPLVPALKSNWLMMHVSVMMLSYATLMVGSLLAIAFLVVTWGKPVSLKGSSVGTGSFRSRTPEPSLEPSTGGGGTTVLTQPTLQLSLQRLTLAETLDNLSYRMIGLGFPLLTIGIISGAVWANEAWGAPWSWDPKETWALIVWLVYAAYLHARMTRDWQGRKPAILATVGFGVVWVCYLGVNLLGKGLHSYGWFF